MHLRTEVPFGRDQQAARQALAQEPWELRADRDYAPMIWSLIGWRRNSFPHVNVVKRCASKR